MLADVLVGCGEVGTVVGDECFDSGSPGDKSDDRVDERVGIHVVDEFGVDAPRLEAGEDADVDLVEGTSVHLAQYWPKEIQSRKWRHFLREGPLEGLLADDASGEDIFDLLESLYQPKVSAQSAAGFR